jgi:hypothetical protein
MDMVVLRPANRRDVFMGALIVVILVGLFVQAEAFAQNFTPVPGPPTKSGIIKILDCPSGQSLKSCGSGIAQCISNFWVCCLGGSGHEWCPNGCRNEPNQPTCKD